MRCPVWTVQETGMFPLLSSNNDMTEGQVEGLRCVQGKRKTGDIKEVIQKIS